jgi:hypothetical protein
VGELTPSPQGIALLAGRQSHEELTVPLPFFHVVSSREEREREPARVMAGGYRSQKAAVDAFWRAPAWRYGAEVSVPSEAGGGSPVSDFRNATRSASSDGVRFRGIITGSFTPAKPVAPPPML